MSALESNQLFKIASHMGVRIVAHHQMSNASWQINGQKSEVDFKNGDGGVVYHPHKDDIELFTQVKEVFLKAFKEVIINGSSAIGKESVFVPKGMKVNNYVKIHNETYLMYEDGFLRPKVFLNEEEWSKNKNSMFIGYSKIFF